MGDILVATELKSENDLKSDAKTTSIKLGMQNSREFTIAACRTPIKLGWWWNGGKKGKGGGMEANFDPFTQF